jgi:hypothetical protein
MSFHRSRADNIAAEDQLFVRGPKDEEVFWEKFKSVQGLRRMKLLYLIRQLHSQFFEQVLYLTSLKPSLII